MKKILLSMAVFAGFGFANAQTVTLSVNDAADVQGTLIEESLKEDGSLSARKHVQPLESMTIDGYKIVTAKGTGTTEPALYYAASTKPEEDMNLRLYKNNTVTISAPEGQSISKVTYVLDGKTTEVEMTGATAGTTFTWTNGTGANIKIITLNVTLGEAGTEPDPIPDPEPGTSDIVDLNVENAAEIQGEVIEEVMGEEGKVTAAKHVQPLESLEIDGYVFTFSSGSNEKTAPAYYWPTSTNANGKRSIRLYNGNTMTVTAPAGVYFNKLVATPDNSSTTTDLYSGAAVNTYTFTASATTRIYTITVTTGEEGSDAPLTDVVFENDMQTSLNGFTVKNEIENDYTGWKMNSNPKCAIANSYTNKENLEAESWLITDVLDLTNRTECSFSFEQGFGFTFPQTADEFYTVQICDAESVAETWDALTMTEFPAAPESGNWTKDWALNTFDISAYDGKKIRIALVYKNDGQGSRAWEVKNFVVKGTPEGMGVEEIETVDTPAEYYTIQGVKVAEPENGLYIRVQNGKATKVLIRK